MARSASFSFSFSSPPFLPRYGRFFSLRFLCSFRPRCRRFVSLFCFCFCFCFFFFLFFLFFFFLSFLFFFPRKKRNITQQKKNQNLLGAVVKSATVKNVLSGDTLVIIADEDQRFHSSLFPTEKKKKKKKKQTNKQTKKHPFPHTLLMIIEK